MTDINELIERLEARNEHLEKRFGYLEGDWERRNHIIESQAKRIAELESAVLAFFVHDKRETRKALRDLVGGFDAVQALKESE